MQEFWGHKGVWVVYDYYDSLTVISTHEHPLAAIVGLASHGGGKIAFLPFGMSISDAVKWWTEAADNYEKATVEVSPLPLYEQQCSEHNSGQPGLVHRHEVCPHLYHGYIKCYDRVEKLCVPDGSVGWTSA